MIRLLALDLDGTLLDSHKQIPSRNAAAVATARDCGLYVVLASGRIGPSMAPYAKELGLGPAMICANGAHVVGPDGQDLLHLGLEPEVTGVVVQYCVAHGLHLNAYSRSRLAMISMSAWGDVYLGRVGTVEPEFLDAATIGEMKPTKLMIVASADEVQRHRPLLIARLAGLPARVVASEPEYLEVLSPDASKGTALSALAGAMGLMREEVAAIGDYLNDLEMVRWAGLSGAVADASPEVREAASVIVPSHDEAGVAEFILEHVLASRGPSSGGKPMM